MPRAGHHGVGGDERDAHKTSSMVILRPAKHDFLTTLPDGGGLVSCVVHVANIVQHVGTGVRTLLAYTRLGVKDMVEGLRLGHPGMRGTESKEQGKEKKGERTHGEREE